jgi:hypothetical protein
MVLISTKQISEEFDKGIGWHIPIVILIIIVLAIFSLCMERHAIVMKEYAGECESVCEAKGAVDTYYDFLERTCHCYMNTTKANTGAPDLVMNVTTHYAGDTK